MRWQFDDIKKYYFFRGLIKRFALPILVVYALDRGLSIDQIAFIAMVGYIGSFVMEVPSGAIADAIGHKRALVLSMIGQSASMAMYLGGNFNWILAANLMYWMSGSLMTGTAEALFYERVKELGRESEHRKLSGQGKGFANLVGVVALAVTSYLYTIAFWIPFLIGVVQFILAGVVIGSFQESKKHLSVAGREGFSYLFSHFSTAFKNLRKNNLLFWVIVSDAVIGGFYFSSAEFHQVLLIDAGLAVTFFGIFYSAKRLVTMIASPFSHVFSRRFTPAQFLLTNWAILVIISAVVPFIKDPFFLAGILVLPAGLAAILGVTTNDYANQQITGTSRATTLSLGNLLTTIIQVATVAALGWFGEHFSVSVGFGALSLVLLGLMLTVSPWLVRAKTVV